MTDQIRKPTFCGYLQVKRPADQRYTLLGSSWRKRLVTIVVDEIYEDDVRLNVVKILLGKKQAYLATMQTKRTDYEEKILRSSDDCFVLKSNDCVIYRCR